jgi:hypothetical protein
MEGLDPSVLQEMMALVSNGMPDPVKLRALLAKNPPLQKMMESMGAGMGMGECVSAVVGVL